MFSIAASSLSQQELRQLIGSVDKGVLSHLQIHDDSKSLSPLEEATVIASLIGGGSAIVAALINGLFSNWNARIAARSTHRTTEKPRVIVTLSRKTLHLTSPDHCVMPEELAHTELVEIRLEQQ